ncbi:MAG: YraN family protein [Omnitrophica bacterium RIFCSPLOWO2_12_FULL_50_11]|nr:MAG: YraN family protein [Omnitrophica bacterium RIFCSPLOWO2_12_FULL_50_11]
MRGKQYSRSVGTEGERLGEAYLTHQGYRILDRNVRSPFGEIDLVAAQGDVLVFVEIKTRSNLAFGFPEEAVNYSKRQKLERLASWYLARHRKRNQAVRFDVLSILLQGTKSEIRLIQDTS